MQIQPYEDSKLGAIKSLSLRAWAPVFDSIEKAMDSDVYHSFYPDGWRVSQLHAVESVCMSADNHVWVVTYKGFILKLEAFIFAYTLKHAFV